MVKLLNKKLEEVITVIQKSEDYQECIKLKEKMKKNVELMQLIDTLKTLQKEYVKNGYQDKEKLEEVENKLYEIPIYVTYMERLEKVNQMISYVEDDLNDYFYQLFN
jgi:cell fate (sporulation/competence/biofilm development) regulator YmcA (YheA/YmcA/DUF963 family)